MLRLPLTFIDDGVQLYCYEFASNNTVHVDFVYYLFPIFIRNVKRI